MTRETDRLYAPIKRPGNGMATCTITPVNEPACVLSVMAGEIRRSWPYCTEFRKRGIIRPAPLLARRRPHELTLEPPLRAAGRI